MLQLFLEGEQVAAEQVTSDSSTTATEAEVNQPANVPEEFDEIVYNKETVKIPVSERQTYLQKGYNYDKVHEAKETLSKQVEALQNAPERKFIMDFVKKQGFDTFEAYQEAIEIKKLTDEGLTEERAKEVLDGRIKREADRAAQELENKKAASDRRIAAEYEEFSSKYPGVSVKTLSEEVQKMYADGVNLSIAYELHQLRQGTDKTKIEQETIAKLQKQETSSPGSATGGNPTHSESYSQMSKTDFDKVVAQAKRGQ